MTLVQYNKKRKFDKTPEPEGVQWTSEFLKGNPHTSKGPLTFVIQRHEASRLHYDFRLELDGVLKSWAVPKGPSLDPEDKRLAMMVEDHPLDYASFEGIIPKGQYGGGTVMVWDRGGYMPYEGKTRNEQEKILLEQLKEGHMTFIMLGEKLKGEFALIKLKNSDEENAWLLVKKSDEYASEKDVLKHDKSVISGRSMSEIEKQAVKKKEIWYSKPKEIDLEDLPKEKMPSAVKPMLAETVDEVFDKKNWIFEMKWDGYRCLAEVKEGKVNLYSRNNLNFNDKFAEIAESLKKFPGEVLLDGEVVVVDKEGKPNFGYLQDYPKSKRGELVYYVFDILHLDGHNLRDLSLLERKELLKKVLPELPHIRYSDHIEEKGKEFFEQVKKQNLEGVIGKNAKSSYKLGVRSGEWVKIKTGLRQEAVICGFTKGKGGRKYFGALILGIWKDHKLQYIGHTGGGFDDLLLEEVYQKLEPLKTDQCPFEVKPQTNAPVTWVKPSLICEVEFRQWTNDQKLRQPVFIGLKEESKVSKESNESEVIVEIGKRKLKLVNLNKEFFPKDGYTKGDLINYYREISPFIVPYLKNRPQSLLRYPNGIEGESFFQKDVSNLKLDWMMRVKVSHDSKKIEYMLIQDEASLIYAINLGCIDLNPWSSRVGKLNYPDYLVIDLDPEEVNFEKVVEVAIECRKVLENLGIESFPKTSGASGMHIYIPMGAKYSYEQVKNFAHLLCLQIHQTIPEITSLERSPKDRKGKVYLDYLQNNHGQTLASVYSVRPHPEAPVSTPLKWEEITKKLHPSQFTIKNSLERVNKQGDLFKEVLGKGIDIKRILKKLDLSS